MAARKVLLAIDGSEHSHRALQFYLETLYREGSEVHLVHALEYPYIPPQPHYIKKEVILEMFSKARTEGDKVADKYKEVLKQKQIPFKLHSEFCKPGEYVCKVAQDEQASLVILGTRGMGSVRRTIMGSVSDYVVHHAHCPVLVARH